MADGLIVTDKSGGEERVKWFLKALIDAFIVVIVVVIVGGIAIYLILKYLGG